MCVTYFFVRRSHYGVPTSTPTKPIATAGWAFGQWHKRSHSFVFRLPPGVCKANATFTGTTGIHEFQFKAGFCQAIYIPWEDVDYDYHLLARESRLGQGDFRVSDHPFPRRQSITDFYNPTQPAYLVQGAVPHGRRRYDPAEYLSPENRYYHPPHETSTHPVCQAHRTWRSHSPSRSRSRSPQPRHPPSPQVSTPPGTPPPPYSPSVGSCLPPSNQRGPPFSDQRQGIYHQSLSQIPLSGKPDLKRFQISKRDFSWRSAASL